VSRSISGAVRRGHPEPVAERSPEIGVQRPWRAPTGLATVGHILRALHLGWHERGHPRFAVVGAPQEVTSESVWSFIQMLELHAGRHGLRRLGQPVSRETGPTRGPPHDGRSANDLLTSRSRTTAAVWHTVLSRPRTPAQAPVAGRERAPRSRRGRRVPSTGLTPGERRQLRSDIAGPNRPDAPRILCTPAVSVSPFREGAVRGDGRRAGQPPDHLLVYAVSPANASDAAVSALAAALRSGTERLVRAGASPATALRGRTVHRPGRVHHRDPCGTGAHPPDRRLRGAPPDRSGRIRDATADVPGQVEPAAASPTTPGSGIQGAI